MQKFLPPSFDQWSTSEPARFYSGDQIFHYMDGAGEVYLAYKYKDLLVQRYIAKDYSEILVEIFDMGSPRNAFGIYSYMQGRGPRIMIGQDAEYRSGLLCFWRDKYFIGIKIEEENERARDAVMKLGKHISDIIGKDGDRPPILKYLSEATFIENSLRYLYRYEILNNHFYLASDNILLLNENTECVFIRMQEDKSYLLLAKYPDDVQADSARSTFLKHYMPEASKSGTIETENKKWTVCTGHKNFIIIVFDARTKPQGLNSIDSIKRRLP